MSCFRMILRCLHVSLSGPGTDKSLHLVRACLNSSFEKGTQSMVSLELSLLRTSVST